MNKNPLKTNSNFLKIIFLISAFLILPLLTLVPTAYSQATESTETEVNDEIKENVKERLEKALSEQTEEIRLKRAWVGILESITNNTLTIGTRDGSKLASVSAETTYVELPSRDEINQDDLEIGSFTIAMGYLNGNHVLNVKRVIIETGAPQLPLRQSQFVKILEYNSKDDTITTESIEGKTQTLAINKNTVITKGAGPDIEEIEADELNKTNRAIIIVEIKENEDQEKTITLLRLHLLSQPEEKVEEEQSSTPSASQED